MEKYVGEIFPNIMKKINRNKKISRYFIALYCGECEYRIQCLSAQGNLSQYVVDFQRKYVRVACSSSVRYSHVLMHVLPSVKGARG